MPQTGLGRGLASLIPDAPKPEKKEQKIADRASKAWGGVNVPVSTGDSDTATTKAESKEVQAPSKNQVVDIPVELIDANPYQPRKTFEEQALDDLVASISTHGILQPLVVVTRGDRFELIAGERRFRAAQKAELTHVPVITRDVPEQEQLELSLIENIQRQNLNPIEEAESFTQLGDEFSLSQEEIAKRVGKSRSSVANTMRLLQLPQEVKQYVRDGKLTEGHAKVLLELDSEAKQVALAKKIIRQQLTVRDTTATVKEVTGKSSPQKKSATDGRLHAWEQKLQALYGTKAHIKDTKGKGRVELEYFSNEELMALLDKLTSVDDLS
ncbi:MAG: ParB/RepB/Spo0J family partition protein [Patescibacteria group bacterium]